MNSKMTPEQWENLVEFQKQLVREVYGGVQCGNCTHYQRYNKCDAFPDGVPDAIAFGEHDHTKPFQGGEGIRYDPIDVDLGNLYLGPAGG